MPTGFLDCTHHHLLRIITRGCYFKPLLVSAFWCSPRFCPGVYSFGGYTQVVLGMGACCYCSWCRHQCGEDRAVKGFSPMLVPRCAVRGACRPEGIYPIKAAYGHHRGESLALHLSLLVTTERQWNIVALSGCPSLSMNYKVDHLFHRHVIPHFSSSGHCSSNSLWWSHGCCNLIYNATAKSIKLCDKSMRRNIINI